ncbi:MAG: hypothetical protein A2504_17380 [Bdellovibrionales bacterium RIFOXYD12_FULL_39_22]|nr:MAG: hypothetical protein A2385_10580 [Bdellovibrionales bacterium RIFOXYB1_FULL_39_21]OFZ48200.1 MAG: hypothetical protein A2404_17310 [Bdellovibrionales bacterium RIFOXYC1_FULL_39_130]OFZ75850.1 MAG: hypothetical protein A2560_13810 [Bdellovibrionales bacterium RIFOXYD1_FULL_39_84]OFZ91911.1 MAG: hypothetical protein A2504_17380 [Bdellovibrionales bacterium RIFOXYD12_FULL_39_22]HLE11420.1 hypothetical protein [Bacteriovoracaceae bacterium]
MRYLLVTMLTIFISTTVFAEMKIKTMAGEFDINLRFKSFIDESGKPEINQSNISMSYMTPFTKMRLTRILKDAGLPALYTENILFVAELSLKFSMAPFLLEDKVKEDLHDAVDEKVQAKVEKGVNAALAGNLYFPMMPTQMQESMRAKLISDTIKSMNTVIEAQKNKLDDRVDEIKDETAYQEIAVVFGKVIEGVIGKVRGKITGEKNDDKAIVYFKAGKYVVENGPAQDDSGLSELDYYRPTRSQTQLAGGAAATTGVTVGYAESVNRTSTFRVDATFFHDREVFYNASDYIERVANFSDEDFDRHADIEKLDSMLIRLLFQKRDNYDVYVSFGKKRNFDNTTAGAGVVLRLSPRNELFIDYAFGENSSSQNSASLILVHKLKKYPSIALHAGSTYANNLVKSNGEELESRVEAIAGISYTQFDDGMADFFNKVFGTDIFTTYGKCSLNLEAIYREDTQQSGNVIYENIGFAGAVINW